MTGRLPVPDISRWEYLMMPTFPTALSRALAQHGFARNITFLHCCHAGPLDGVALLLKDASYSEVTLCEDGEKQALAAPGFHQSFMAER